MDSHTEQSPLVESAQQIQPVNQPPSPRPSNIFITLIVFIIVTIVGIGGYLFATKNQSTQNQTKNLAQPTIPQPSPIIDPTADWQTYRNEEFGFEVRYPKSIKLATTKEAIEVIPLGYIRLCNFGDALACFYIPRETYPNSTFEAAALSVETFGKDVFLYESFDRSKSEENCLRNFIYDETTKYVVNGIVFWKISFGDGASGHTYGGFHYRTYYNGQCLQLTTGISTYNRAPSDFPEEGIRTLSDNEGNEIFSVVDQILSTFRFTP